MQNEKDYSPDQPFEGLGFIKWMKLIFQTRARTLKQADNVLALMMNKNAELATNNEFNYQTSVKLAQLTLKQNAALIAAKDAMDEVGMYGPQLDQLMTNHPAYDAVNEAIAAGQQKL